MIRATLQSALCLLLAPLLAAQQIPASTSQPTPASGRNLPAPAQSAVITIPKGTGIPLVLLESVSSATAQKKQSIRLAVARDVLVDGTVVIRRGTAASGVITEARKAIPGKRDGYASLALVSLNLPDGSVPVTEYVGGGGGGGGDGGDGWCWGFGSCLVLIVIMYVFYLPIMSVKNLFSRQRPTVSGEDQTKAACLPIWAATETTHSINIAHSDAPQQAEEVDATCPMAKDDFAGSARP